MVLSLFALKRDLAYFNRLCAQEHSTADWQIEKLGHYLTVRAEDKYKILLPISVIQNLLKTLHTFWKTVKWTIR